MAVRWYVVHVYSGFEKKVAQSIEEQARQNGMDDKILQIMVPVEEVVEMRRGAKVKSERKFFPGYVLAQMEMTDETWHLVKNTPKGTDFLGGKGRPTPITDSEADRILRVLHSLSNGLDLVVLLAETPVKVRLSLHLDLVPVLADAVGELHAEIGRYNDVR